MNQKSNNNLLETFNNPNVEHDFLIKIKIPEEGAYHEAVTGKIFEHLMSLLSPRYLNFKSKFNVRGGIYTDVEFTHRNDNWKPRNKIK